jgi:hypothetical protein
MVQINFARKEINCKIVYYGPGLSGKTTSLEVVHQRTPEGNKGELTSISTDGDRTLFFDFMPLDLGSIAGMQTKFHLYTVPGQVYYNSTRKLVLLGADGIIFVADSSAGRLDDNFQSMENLRQNLAEMGRDINKIPLVVQYNKRDMPNAMAVAEMEAKLNPNGVPSFEASAKTGEGIFQTLKAISALVLEDINSNEKRVVGGAGVARRPTVRPVTRVESSAPELQAGLLPNQAVSQVLRPTAATAEGVALAPPVQPLQPVQPMPAQQPVAQHPLPRQQQPQQRQRVAPRSAHQGAPQAQAPQFQQFQQVQQAIHQPVQQQQPMRPVEPLRTMQVGQPATRQQVVQPLPTPQPPRSALRPAAVAPAPQPPAVMQTVIPQLSEMPTRPRNTTVHQSREALSREIRAAGAAPRTRPPRTRRRPETKGTSNAKLFLFVTLGILAGAAAAMVAARLFTDFPGK